MRRGAWIFAVAIIFSPVGAVSHPAPAPDAFAVVEEAILSLVPGAGVPEAPGLTVVHTYRAFTGAFVRAPTPVLDALRLHPDILGVYPNEPLELHLDQALAAHGITAGASVPETGRGIAVAVVDSGIDPNHPGLSGRVASYQVTSGGVQPSLLSVDPSAHGTHVAGIIAGDGTRSPENRYRGVAPDARIIGLDLAQAFNTNGALRAFDWVLDNHVAEGIRVVSNSWGRTGEVDGRFDADAPLVRASDALTAEGVLVVFSAGNRGAQSSMDTEALNPSVLAVGATDVGGQLASFSSRGPGLDERGGLLPWTKPDLVADGVDVISARGGLNLEGATTQGRNLAPLDYRRDQGTSMAAAVVSGAAALLFQANPSLSARDAMAILKGTAFDLGAPGLDNETGAGFIDVQLALEMARTGQVPAGDRVHTSYVQYGFRVAGLLGLESQVTPWPGISFGDGFGAKVPVPPGTSALSVEVRWTPTAFADFTARLRDGDGRWGPRLTGAGNILRADVLDPLPGSWTLVIEPEGGLFEADLTIEAGIARSRTVPTAVTLEDLYEGGFVPSPPPRSRDGFAWPAIPDMWLVLAGAGVLLVAILAVALAATRRRT